MKESAYEAYLDTCTEVILLVEQYARDRVCEPFFLIDRKTEEQYELRVTSVHELPGTMKYALAVIGFINFENGYYLIDSKDVKIPLLLGAVTRSECFDELFYDPTAKLGVTYSTGESIFRIWSPTALKAQIVIYCEDGSRSYYRMKRGNNGVWCYSYKGDLEFGKYRYIITQPKGFKEVTDPYGVASTANGEYSVVVDMRKTVAIKNEARPKLLQPTDAVIYEVSVRDFTVKADLDDGLKGKFQGLEQIDYLRDLGVTHIQLLPVFDFEGVDELAPLDAYNWGYNPAQYNVPEGSYATDLINPYTRINDLKSLINALHEKGLGVIMDVVYNHVSNRKTFPFDTLVPNYFYRYDSNGLPTEGSGCGNDVASERGMARKYILDSISFWINEYGIDGFRFDLMGLLDVYTMNEIRKLCDSIDPGILLYGEGWNLNTALADEKKASYYNAHLMPGISHFNDTFRDSIKGPTFEHHKKGLTLGDTGLMGIAQHLLAGSSGRRLGESFKFFSPAQSINYVECHDNHTFWDRARISNFHEDDEILRKRQLLATAMVIFAQGIPFIHGGQEFFRSKNGVENSYLDNDEINAINWDDVARFRHEIDLFKGYIKIRKAHAALRFATGLLVKKHVFFANHHDAILEYALKDVGKFGEWEEIRIFFNLKHEPAIISDLCDDWNVIADENYSGTRQLYTVNCDLMVAPLSTVVIVK